MHRASHNSTNNSTEKYAVDKQSKNWQARRRKAWRKAVCTRVRKLFKDLKIGDRYVAVNDMEMWGKGDEDEISNEVSIFVKTEPTALGHNAKNFEGSIRREPEDMEVILLIASDPE